MDELKSLEAFMLNAGLISVSFTAYKREYTFVSFHRKVFLFWTFIGGVWATIRYGILASSNSNVVLWALGDPLYLFGSRLMVNVW